MTKLISIMILFALGSYGFEQTLTSNPVLLLPKAGYVTADARQVSETITAGDYRTINGKMCVAQTGGVTADAMATNEVVTTDTARITVSGSLTPDAAGTYLLVSDNYYTNANYSIWHLSGDYRITAKAKAYTGTTNFWSTSNLIGAYTNHGGYVGIATVSHPTVTTEVYTAVSPALVNGVTTDGAVSWLQVPAVRTKAILDVLNGDCVLTDRDGNKIYKTVGKQELDFFSGALFGTSTNSAKVEVFQY